MILFKLKYSGAVPGIAKRELNRIIKSAFEQAGIYWHKFFRPKHFTHAGAREYGYTPRKGERGSGKRFRRSYTGRKLRKKGHTLPLVYSGLSRSLTRMRDVRATSKGVRVVLHAPALNFRHPESKINMREEMTRVSAGERKVLIRLMNRYMDRRLKAIRRTQTKRIG